MKLHYYCNTLIIRVSVYQRRRDVTQVLESIFFLIFVYIFISNYIYIVPTLFFVPTWFEDYTTDYD